VSVRTLFENGLESVFLQHLDGNSGKRGFAGRNGEPPTRCASHTAGRCAIFNGKLMAVMIDDDPASSNNKPGMFGIEIEATTKVQVRNIWVRKIN
jgi:hypothetical protein